MLVTREWKHFELWTGLFDSFMQNDDKKNHSVKRLFIFCMQNRPFVKFATLKVALKTLLKVTANGDNDNVKLAKYYVKIHFFDVFYRSLGRILTCVTSLSLRRLESPPNANTIAVLVVANFSARLSAAKDNTVRKLHPHQPAHTHTRSRT